MELITLDISICAKISDINEKKHYKGRVNGKTLFWLGGMVSQIKYLLHMKLSQYLDMKVPHVVMYGSLKGVESFFQSALKKLKCKRISLLGICLQCLLWLQGSSLPQIVRSETNIFHFKVTTLHAR